MPRQQTHGYSHAIHIAWLDNMRGGASAIKSMVQTHNRTVTTVAEAVSEGVLQLEPVVLSKVSPLLQVASGSGFHLTFGSTNPSLVFRKCLFQNHLRISWRRNSYGYPYTISITICIHWLEPLFWGELSVHFRRTFMAHCFSWSLDVLVI